MGRFSVGRLIIALVILAAIFLFRSTKTPPPGTSTETTETAIAQYESEVRARSEALVTAEEAFDWDTAITFYAPDVVVQPANAPQYQGRDAHLEVYRTFPAMLEFEGTTTDIVAAASGDLAYEYGVNRFVFDTPDGPVEDSGKYLVVWKKTDGEWFVAAFSFSGDSPPSG